MNKLTYNASMATALCSITAGAALIWGTGVCLIVFGVMLAVLTLASIVVAY
jgi:hypothetical protein